MQMNRVGKIIFLMLLSFGLLHAKDVLVDPDGNQLHIKKGEVILLNFPFAIKDSKNIEIFGNQKSVSVKFKGNSVYFVTTMLPLKMLVYGAKNPIYIDFASAKNQKKPAKIFNFKMGSLGNSDSSKKNSLRQLDKEIITFVKNISPDGAVNNSELYEEKINKKSMLDGLNINYESRYELENFYVDVYKVKNNTLTEKSLKKYPFFTKENKIIANFFINGNGHLDYSESTTAYIFRDNK